VTAQTTSVQVATERLYYHDAYATEMSAQLLAVTEYKGQPAWVLDQTIFYPTSGGQPFDRGTLGGHQVVDVVAEKDGTIYHLLTSETPDAQPDSTVEGTIDWPRRYDHMQQHSGQHLLSQIFYQELGYETVSVHFGDEESTLDLDVEAITTDELSQIESAANTLVYANKPITAYFVNDSELASVPLRRPPKVTGKIRIVEIEGFDYSACGGTHCHTTSELGPIKLLRTERRRGQSRVTFLCGWRAVRDYQQRHETLVQAAQLFSTDISQVPVLIERNLAQLKELQGQVSQLQETQLSHDAAALIQQNEVVGDYRLICQQFEEREVNQIKLLANYLRETAQTVALLTVANADKLTAIFARSDDLSYHMGNLLKTTLNEFGGGGGGRPELAQGGGVVAQDAVPFLARARELIKEQA